MLSLLPGGGVRNVAGSWAVLSAQWGPGGARALQPPPAACSVLDCPVPVPSSASSDGRECCLLGQKGVVCVWFWFLLRVLSGSVLLDSSGEIQCKECVEHYNVVFYCIFNSIF